MARRREFGLILTAGLLPFSGLLLAALPRDKSDVEDLLIGGTGKVWKYTAPK